MNLFLTSDLHLEMGEPYDVRASGFDVAVLAGDIHTKGRGVAWAKSHFSGPVVYVPGNHEGYGSHWEKIIAKMKAEAEGSHVHVLHQDALVLQGVRFLGVTGWSDFKAWPHPSVAMAAAGAGRGVYDPGQKDYRFVRTAGYRRIRPSDTIGWSIQARLWLQEKLKEPFGGPTVVVTHHAPSVRSLPGKAVSDILDVPDVNLWDDLVESSGAVLWCHGHIHTPTDYTVGKTRVVSNPRGYPGGNLGHRPDLLLPV